LINTGLNPTRQSLFLSPHEIGHDTLREVHGQKVFENRALRSTFGFKKVVVK